MLLASRPRRPRCRSKHPDDAEAVAGLDDTVLNSESSTANESSAPSSDEQTGDEENSAAQAATQQSDNDSEQTAAAEQTANANLLELTFNEQSWTEIFDAGANNVARFTLGE